MLLVQVTVALHATVLSCLAQTLTAVRLACMLTSRYKLSRHNTGVINVEFCLSLARTSRFTIFFHKPGICIHDSGTALSNCGTPNCTNYQLILTTKFRHIESEKILSTDNLWVVYRKVSQH